MKNIMIVCNSVEGLYSFREMLIKRLIELGYNVTAIIPLIKGVENNIAAKRLDRIGCNLIQIEIDRRGINPIKDLKLLFNYYRTIKRLNPNLVITYTIKPNIYVGIVCRILDLKYVTNITGLGSAFKNNDILCSLVMSLYRIALKKAKVVFFENIKNRNLIVESGIIRREQSYVLPGAGVELEKFSFQNYPLDDECCNFLYIGRVMKEKGIEELFQVMHSLYKKGYKCTLDVVGGYEENYQSLVDQYEKEGWLKYWGYQSDVRPFIKKCHCFVLPSWHEGMANSNLECAASGRPIITSNIFGCKEAVINNVSGILFEKKNSVDLENKMIKFIKMSYEQKVVMGKEARRHMVEKFDKRIVVEQTINVIKQNCNSIFNTIKI